MTDLRISRAIQEDKEKMLRRLSADILDRHERPEDVYEVAAIIESMGINDERAETKYSFGNVFELADEVWDFMRDEFTFVSYTTVEKSSFWRLFFNMIRYFLRGLIFAFPMGISVASMLVLQFSLWSYINFSLGQATAIAIGTILSFVTVGGFTQAIARRGFFYIIQNYYSLARKNTFLFIFYGFILCLITILLIIWLNMTFNLFSYSMIFNIFIYYIFLTAIWLSVTALYILQKELVFTGLLTLGIGFVYVLYKILHINVIISQLIALFIVSILSIVLVLYYFYQMDKRTGRDALLNLPRLSITIYSVGPYFFYGLLYFAFLFVDRVNAWSTHQTLMPFVVWFRADYEVGLDFALLTLIIPMGVSEVIVQKLMLDLESHQKGFLATEIPKLYKELMTSYRRMFWIMLVVGVISGILVYFFSLYYNHLSILLSQQNLLQNKTTLYVMYVGIFSYIILSICLMNAVILFALSQPAFIINAILPSFIINFILGFLLTRWIGYQYAVVGLLVGSIYFSVVSTRAVRKVLKNVDYYLYAAS